MELKIKIEGREYRIKEGATIIGRSKDSDITIESINLSRAHTRIAVEGQEVTVEDLESRNGTFVNGRKITERTLVVPGDTVKIADLPVEFIFPETPDQSPVHAKRRRKEKSFPLGSVIAVVVIVALCGSLGYSYLYKSKDTDTAESEKSVQRETVTDESKKTPVAGEAEEKVKTGIIKKAEPEPEQEMIDPMIQTVPGNNFYVDNAIKGEVDKSGDCIGTYDPDTRTGGTGTETAFNTFMEASLAVEPGDTVMIRGGTYKELLRPERSGEPGMPITYKNYYNEEVLITGVPSIGNLTPDEFADDHEGDRYGIYIYDKKYIIIEGLHIDNISWWARIVKSKHIIVRNNTFTRATAGGAGASVRFEHCKYCKILNNKLHDGCDNLTLFHSDRNLIEGNRITKGHHTLWCIRAGWFNVVRNNYFHNESQKIGEIYDAATDPPISFNDAKYNLVENNTFAFTASSGNAASFAGIQYAGQNGIIRRNEFYHNTGSAIGFALYGGEAQYNYENRTFHNVFYKNDAGSVGVCKKSDKSYGNVFKNNIFLRSTFVPNDTRCPLYTIDWAGKPIQVIVPEDDGYLFEKNVFFNEKPGEPYLITKGASPWKSDFPQQHPLSWWEKNFPSSFRENMEADPLFVDEQNYDFHLKKESPVIDAGTFLTKTSSSGSGTALPVEDVGYFYDGFDIPGEKGELIQLEGDTRAVRITDINYEKNILVLESSLSWKKGQGVSLAYTGKGPDIGMYEYGQE